jgi:iron complex outermembrane receptor protein
MLSFSATGSACIASHSFALKEPGSFFGQEAHWRANIARCVARAMGLLFCCLVASLSAIAQNSAPANAGATSQPSASKPAAAVEKIQRVTTTVVVHGQAVDDYLPEAVTVGTLDGAALKDTPISATVVTRELLTDQGARVLSDVVKNDASIGEDYAPVGYYGDYEIRGFPIDLATGLQINGMTIAGEQDVPLENKERVEFLKGIAGVESGVASAGGLIDYVTKRPATIEALDVATDHRGSSYGAVDLGRLFGSRKQVGARVNLAGEKIQSYVNETDGWRAAGTGAADWKLTPKAIFKGDFEYQHKVQRSVCGYQLLGGDTALDEPSLPNIDKLYPSTLLGEQSWTKPNTFDTINTGARFDYDLPHGLKVFAAASYSHSLIDDNVIYPYGCEYQAVCTDLGGTSPDYYFTPDGSYDIYDYRNPGELRIDAQAEALVTGHVKTGVLTHDLTGGGELFRRSVQQPKHSVNEYIGSENIYEANIAFPIESVDGAPKKPGPRILDDDNHQSAAVVQDRIHIPGRIQLLISGREDSLRDRNYNGTKTSGDLNFTKRTIWLPQYAVTFNPVNDLTLYANYGVLLSLGIQAPWWTDNDEVYLDPYLTRQAEIGAKYQPSPNILLTTAFFHMRAPFFYTKIVDGPDSFCTENLNATGPDYSVHPNDPCFESEGHETNDGIEVNAEGKAAKWLRLTASAAAIRAISDGTGTLSIDNKQVTNVPHLRTALFADLLLPHARGLHLMPGWSYTGRKEATGDDRVSVSSYNVFNLGARYTPGGEQGRVTLRIYADNITDKRYWKDTGSNYGDTFVHMGAPTTVRLSAHYTF